MRYSRAEISSKWINSINFATGNLTEKYEIRFDQKQNCCPVIELQCTEVLRGRQREMVTWSQDPGDPIKQERALCSAGKGGLMLFSAQGI